MPGNSVFKYAFNAGTDAVMIARLVSMFEVTKPMTNIVGEVGPKNRPWARITRRSMLVIVTLRLY